MATNNGQCDNCGRDGVRLFRGIVTGIETYACSICSGHAPRRCEGGACDLNGDCLYCGAFNGEICCDQ